MGRCPIPLGSLRLPTDDAGVFRPCHQFLNGLWLGEPDRHSARASWSCPPQRPTAKRSLVELPAGLSTMAPAHHGPNHALVCTQESRKGFPRREIVRVNWTSHHEAPTTNNAPMPPESLGNLILFRLGGMVLQVSEPCPLAALLLDVYGVNVRAWYLVAVDVQPRDVTISPLLVMVAFAQHAQSRKPPIAQASRRRNRIILPVE